MPIAHFTTAPLSSKRLLPAEFFRSPRPPSLNFDQCLADYVLFITHELNNEMLRIEALVHSTQSGCPAAGPDTGATEHPLATFRQLLLQLKRSAAAADQGYACTYSPVDLTRVADTQRIRLLSSPDADRFHLVASAPLRIVGDAFLLNCAVRNLVDNALTYTRGTVRVSVRSEPGTNTVHLWVEDEGNGFFSALRSPWAAPSGWGLGKSIVATIARLHGAELRVRTEPMHGVGLIFPAPPPPRSTAFAQSSATVSVTHQ